MPTARKAAVAGTFYPADKTQLKAMISQFYDKAEDQPAVGKFLIAPHAGYIYSGEIAASCYAPLRKRSSEITKVILIGPSHYVGFSGLAIPTTDFYETPLGNIPIDKELAAKAVQLSDVMEYDQAHLQEHSLEVHLPFLQESLENFTLLPVVVGMTEPENVAELIKLLWGGDETLFVISSDLSHYKDYEDACSTDSATTKKIESLNTDFDHYNACGCTPIKGMIIAAKEKKLKPRLIDLRNSGDTAGSKDRVVGYASFICDKEEKLKLVLNSLQKKTLLELAHYSIASKLGIETPKPDISILPGINAATFVTLKMNGQLRGCIGTLMAHRPLVDDVMGNALSAAFRDPRFSPVTAYEYMKLKISISLLTDPEEITFSSEEDLLSKIRPGVDGLILADGNKRGTFLPSVWEDLPSKELFWSHLKNKAGLPGDYWSPTLKVQRYTSVYISE